MTDEYDSRGFVWRYYRGNLSCLLFRPICRAAGACVDQSAALYPEENRRHRLWSSWKSLRVLPMATSCFGRIVASQQSEPGTTKSVLRDLLVFQVQDSIQPVLYNSPIFYNRTPERGQLPTANLTVPSSRHNPCHAANKTLPRTFFPHARAPLSSSRSACRPGSCALRSAP